jgi:hypothetical protein
MKNLTLFYTENNIEVSWVNLAMQFTTLDQPQRPPPIQTSIRMQKLLLKSDSKLIYKLFLN